jgi:hypothetical protein
MTATTLTGGPATEFDSVKYVLDAISDSVRVNVTPAGLVTGLAPTSIPVQIDLLAFANGTVRADKVLVNVTPTATSGLTLSLQPTASDSTKLASGSAKSIIPLLRNPTTGDTVAVPLLQYDVNPSDATRVAAYTSFIRMSTAFNGLLVERRLITPTALTQNQIMPLVGEGTAWIYGEVNAYGSLLRDSVLYTFTYPYTATVATHKSNLALLMTVNAGSALSSPAAVTLTLAPGAIVTFSNSVPSTDSLTITYTFDTPAAATAPPGSPSTAGGASGNVTPLAGGQSSRRQFLTPGTYHWTTDAAGGPAPWPGQTFTGTIIVQ